MLRKIFFGAIGAVALLGTANAADMPARTQYYKAPPAVFNWTGFYVGAHLGYGWANTDPDSGLDPSGVLGGAQIGYNWQAIGSSIVFGIEADITASDVYETVGAFDFGLSYMGTIRGRLGVAMDRSLFYVTGGYAYGEGEVAIAGVSFTENGDGWVAGLGWEWAFARNWSARVEYLYYDLSFDGFDIEASTLRLGVNYRF